MVQSAIQVQGITTWGITLLSINSAEPAGRQQVARECQKKWSKYCLDGTDLNASGVKAIIAVGVILIVAAITGLMVWLDVRRRSGKVWPSSCFLHRGSCMELMHRLAAGLGCSGCGGQSWCMLSYSTGLPSSSSMH